MTSGKDIKSKLLEVDPNKLVDLIFDLASDNDVAWSKVERLVSKPNENSQRFLRRLNEIKNRGGFVPWKYSSEFADELTDILEDLNTGVSSAEEGFQLICEFYRADEDFFNMADDSSGHIGDVYRGPALELFVKFASQLSDKKMIIHAMIDLMKDDGYGVRDEIIDQASKFLTPDDLRELFKILENDLKNKDRKLPSYKLGSIAKQLGDAPLFEKLTRSSGYPINSRTIAEIAEVYYSTGNINKAQEILNTAEKSDHFGTHECEELQKKIYVKQGKTDELYQIVYQAFHRHYSEYTLRDLLEVAGKECHEEFVKSAVEKILSKNKWDSSDAEFLVFVAQTEALEKYVLAHRLKILDGIFYSASNIADYLVESKKPLAATILYRGLIAETLKKSIAKYYHHAVRYLEILDQFCPQIKDWDVIENHEIYFQELKKKHSQKRSLWAKYGK